MLTKLKNWTVGLRSSKVISHCVGYTDDPFLEWADSWHTYIKDATQFGLSPLERHTLMDDALSGRRPWTWTAITDAPAGSIYMELDSQGLPLKTPEWKFIYRFRDTDELVDWEKLPKEKQRKLIFRKFWGNVDKEMMAVPPLWYSSVKHSLLHYVESIRWKWVLTDEGLDSLQFGIHSFFWAIESWTYDGPWREVIYKLYTSDLANHWYLMSKMFPRFDQVMSDPDFASTVVGRSFDKPMDFRRYAEAVSSYVGKQRWGQYTLLDSYPNEVQQKFYGKLVPLLYKEVDGKMIPAFKAKEGPLTKSYLSKLTWKQQIEQLKAVDGLSKKGLNYWNALWYLWFGAWAWGMVMRFVNLIGKPALMSTFMSLSQGLTSLIPLLVLNSSMFVSELAVRKTRLGWDWQRFMNKHGLQDWVGYAFHAGDSSYIPQTLGEVTRQVIAGAKNTMEQGLFNVWDTLMQDYYRINQFKTFFEGMFPWVRTLDEIDNLLDAMRRNDPEEYQQLMQRARNHNETIVRNMTTNTSIRASLTRVHATENPVFQAWKDLYYSMFHFFAGWWWNKVIWFYDISKAGLGNIYRWQIWARYLDELLNSGMRPREVRARMNKAYLENEAFRQVMSKMYMSFMLAKFLERASEDPYQAKEDDLSKDLMAIFEWFKFFDGNVAWLQSVPEFKIFRDTLTLAQGMIENDAPLQQAILWVGLKGLTTYSNIFTRKLFMPKIFANAMGSIQDPTDQRELFQKYWWAVQDTTTAFLYYVAQDTEIGEYDLYTPAGPNAMARRFTFSASDIKEEISKIKDVAHYVNSVMNLTNLKHHILFRAPFFKNYMIPALPEMGDFYDVFDNFTKKNEGYKKLINSEVPDDMYLEDYIFLFNLGTRRQIKKWDIDKFDMDTLLRKDFSFVGKDWKEWVNMGEKAQEDLLHTLMIWGLTTEELKKFSEDFKNARDLYAAAENENIAKAKKNYESLGLARMNIARTLAYVESKAPWYGVQALSYMMSNAWYEDMFQKWEYVAPGSSELFQEKAKYVAAKVWKEFAWHLLYLDRKDVLPQAILHYAKYHDPNGLGKYVEEPSSQHNNTLDLRLPWSDQGNTRLMQIFKAEYAVNLLALQGENDAYKVANAFSTIFDLSKSRDKNGEIPPELANMHLAQMENIYKYIDNLAMDEGSKAALKQGTLLFSDQLVPHILKSEKYSQDKDMKEVVKSWTDLWYRELNILDWVVKEQAEDDYMWKEFNNPNVSKNSYKYTGDGSARRSFYRAYDYIRNRAYSSNWRTDYARTGKLPNYGGFAKISSPSGYSQFRDRNYVQRLYTPDYLRESEFRKAKEAQERAWLQVGRSQAASKGWGYGKMDWGPGLVTKTWKAIAVYKREDIDKPVEYKLPWRKRWVRKWKWVDPIWSSTRKRLTPKLKIT